MKSDLILVAPCIRVRSGSVGGLEGHLRCLGFIYLVIGAAEARDYPRPTPSYRWQLTAATLRLSATQLNDAVNIYRR